MAEHVKILGILYLISGIFTLFLAGCFGIFFLVLSAVAAGDPDTDENGAIVLLLIGVFATVFVFLVAIPDIIAGFGLIKHRSWSRILAIVLGAIHVFSFPFGTALAVYTFWVLLQDKTKALLADSRPSSPAGS